MNETRLRLGLLLLTLLLGVGAATRWRHALVFDARAQGVKVSSAPPVRAFSRDSLSAAANRTTSNDPFRLSNAPTSVTFASTLAPAAPKPIAVAPPVPPRVRPALMVRAIIGGPPWSAIVDGIPGQPAGTVVNPGSEFQGFHVTSITRDTVVVQGADTTWNLAIKRSGP
jgi:hypothetical protein